MTTGGGNDILQDPAALLDCPAIGDFCKGIIDMIGASFLEMTAVHYLRNTRLNVEDIAFLLGFSDCPPFVRAVKRWRGRSPLAYRRNPLAGND